MSRNLQTTARQVICTICQERPTNARRLPCFDIFCRQCLEGLVESCPPEERNRLICPNCRYQIDLQRNGIDNFPRALIQSIRSSNPQSSAFIQCPEHVGNPMELFCFQCEEVICQRCKRSNHRVHNTGDLANAIDERKKDLENALHEEIESNSVNLHSELELINRQAKRIDKNKKKDIAELQKQVDTLKNAINSISNDLTQALDRHYVLEHDDIEYQLQIVRSKINGSQQFIDEGFLVLSENNIETTLLNYRGLMDLKSNIQNQLSPQNEAVQGRLFSKGSGANKSKLERMIGKVKPPVRPESRQPDLRPDTAPSVMSRYRVLPNIIRNR